MNDFFDILQLLQGFTVTGPSSAFIDIIIFNLIAFQFDSVKSHFLCYSTFHLSVAKPKPESSF